MTITLFRSTKDHDLFGFTSDETGANLPPEFAPWHRSGRGKVIQIGSGSGLINHPALAEVVQTVQRDGFCLARGKSAVTRQPASATIH